VRHRARTDRTPPPFNARHADTCNRRLQLRARGGGRASVVWVRPPGGASFGVSAEPFTGLRLTAAATVFVDVTRPRELLGLALRKSEAMHLLGPAEVQGWKLVDLVARAAMSAG